MSTTNHSPSSNGRGSPAWSSSWMHFSVDCRSPRYCHVTFDHPPINTITATTVAELAELVGLLEQDQDLNVVVFDSANPDFYLAHYDAENDLGRSGAFGFDRTGLRAWIDVLVRLAHAPVVSIASIRGRASGAGTEFVLACDLRFASRENTSLGLVTDDLNGPQAQECGYVNRVIDDQQLDTKVDAIAARLARFDHDAIARTKSYVGPDHPY